MRILLIPLFICISGCAGARLNAEGQKVRLVSTAPAGCTYIGEVTGTASMMDMNPEESARTELKNKAAASGADTVDIGAKRQALTWITGEGYQCGERKPSALSGHAP